jgi:hypothetical protein
MQLSEGVDISRRGPNWQLRRAMEFMQSGDWVAVDKHGGVMAFCGSMVVEVPPCQVMAAVRAGLWELSPDQECAYQLTDAGRKALEESSDVE